MKAALDPTRSRSRRARSRERLFATRKLTLDLAAPLSDADATIQPFPDASPAKWHLAHTTWFFETFVLRDHVAGYRPFDERFAFLFNSYYEGEGAAPRAARAAGCSAARRSTRSAPIARMSTRRSSARCRRLPPAALELIELGINHEQQHQELFLTDILATFAENPLEPAYGELPPPACFAVEPLTLAPRPRGHRRDRRSRRRLRLRQRAAAPPRLPRARTSSPTAGSPTSEWREFIADGGYRNADPVAVRRLGLGPAASGIAAPLYWHDDGTRVHARRPARDRLGGAGRARQLFTKPTPSPAGPARGFRPRPNGRISPPRPIPIIGNQLDEAGAVVPRPGGGMFGDVWEWTQSAFASYPGFAPAEGAVGEYNGKFMCGQLVLKGASCATPRGHSRASYRNFFPPAARWQFTGLRLARDA